LSEILGLWFFHLLLERHPPSFIPLHPQMNPSP
jgi:hypothetical protein